MVDDIKDVLDVSEVLGDDEVDKIINKEWKVADLPSEEDLAAEEHKSPKARSNPNSRKNLVQYRKNKPKEAKKKAIQNLKTSKKRDKVDPFHYIKLMSDEKRHLLRTFLPTRTILASATEEISFYSMISSLLSDFDEEDLTAGDIEDVIGLALTRVITDRLLEAAARDRMAMLDVGPTIERFQKQRKEFKANLANRRADRTDPRAKQNFSIIDLVHSYDKKRKKEMEERIEGWEAKKKAYKEDREKK